MNRLGFIGYGNMAGAIIGGVISSGYKEKISVFDTNKDKYQNLPQNIVGKNTANDVIEESDYIVLAVKPQHITAVFDSITADLSNKIFVTILAGVSTAYIRELAKMPNLKVVRAMPNTPLLVGKGATALCKTDNVTVDEFEFAKILFSNSGVAIELSEDKMNSVIAINGSSPAYIFLFAMAVQNYAKQVGLDENDALKLFCQTLSGSADMMLKSGKTPEELKIMVSSPGGTTLAALDVFEKNNFTSTVIDAMDACTKRAGELGK